MMELRRGILNLRLDLKRLEEKHRLPTEEFYEQFSQGALDDREEFIIWSGLYEMLCENEKRLQELG
jgi:hypothetical protein